MYYVSHYEVTYSITSLTDIWNINEEVVPLKLYTSEQGITRHGKYILEDKLFQTEDKDEALGYLTLEGL